MTDYFYAELPVGDSFSAILDPETHVLLPENWYVVAADVENSTESVENGRYKEVNFIGASVIAAVRNAAKPIEIPFVFGGDGAFLCVPDSVVDKVCQALSGCRKLAMEGYGMALRVGIFPVSTIRKAGYEVLLAKHRVAKNHCQAVISGGGLAYADKMLKEGEGEIGLGDGQADFSGLQCRWEIVPSRRGETIALLVNTLGKTAADNARVYQEIMREIAGIYGDDRISHPVSLDALKMSFDSKTLAADRICQAFGRPGLMRALMPFKLLIANYLGSVFMSLGIKIAGVRWGDYKANLIAHTDNKKFDDMLRLVLSGTKEMREKLKKILDGRLAKGELTYGIHASSASQITCLVFDRNTDHVHFVDATGGGYALAAKQMKQRAGQAV